MSTSGFSIASKNLLHRLVILFLDGISSHPAVQIRQMGTRESWRRQGLASGLVIALEAAAISQWGAKSGWLQARLSAIPMYASEGWKTFGEEYEVVGIGPHLSMWKMLVGDESN